MGPPGHSGQHPAGSDRRQQGRCDYRQNSSMRAYTLPSAYISNMQGRNSQYMNIPNSQMQPPSSHSTAYNQSSYNWDYGVGSSYGLRPLLPPTPPVSSRGSKFMVSDHQDDQSSHYMPTYSKLPRGSKAEDLRHLARNRPTSALNFPMDTITSAQDPLPTHNSITNNNSDAEGSIDIDNDSPFALTCDSSRSATPASEASLFIPSSPSPPPAPRPRTRSSTTAALTTSLVATSANAPSSAQTPKPASRRNSTRRPRPKVARRNPASDPENIQIKELHTVRRLAWSDIAVIMNEQRRAAGQPEPFTEAAVYGRFKRNAGKIAEDAGEAFKMSDWIHMGVGKDGVLEVRAGRRVAAGGDSDGEMGGGQRAGDLKGEDAMSRAGDMLGLDMAMGQAKVDGFSAAGEGEMLLSSIEEDEILLLCYDEVHSQPWLLVAEKLQRRTGKAVDAMACMERVRVLRGGGV